MKIAAAYLRVSTEDQDEYSLDSQLKLIREYADKNDYIVPEEYVFIDDGISGRTAAKRKRFLDMIAMAKEKEHPFDTILLWKFSRFARNQEESIFYKAVLRKIDVNVVSISEPLPEGPFASLIERIIEWMDEFYSIRLSGEVKRGMLEKASRGEPVSIAPFGYTMVDNKLIPDEKATVVRYIFEAYLSGAGMRSIARDLGDRGIRTNRGGVPDNRFVEYILNNPAYIGKIRWSKEGRAASTRDYENENILIYDGHHEPIITDELWQAVQDRLAEQKKLYPKYARRNEPAMFMLKGLLRCSDCGSTLVRMSTACPSVQCHKYARGQCKVSHSISIAKANRAVIASLENSVTELSFRLEPAKKPEKSRPDDISRLIALEKRKLQRIQEAYENGIDTLEEYAEKKRKVLAELERLSQQAPAQEPAMVDVLEFAKKVEKVIGIIKSPDVDEASKNEALRSVIAKIVYDKPSQSLDIYFYT